MIDIDSESEPPTQDDCPEPSVAQAINAAVPGTEVDCSAETNDTEDEPDTEDDAMVIEEEEKDEFVKGIIARTIADEAKSRKEREERARKEDEEHVRKTLEAAEEARQRRVRSPKRCLSRPPWLTTRVPRLSTATSMIRTARCISACRKPRSVPPRR